MAQHDYVIDNQTAPNFRSDLNNALSAIVSTNSGASAPSTTYANMLWYDTTNDILKMRNEANSAWINIGTLNQSTGEFEVANLTTLTQADWEAGIVTTEALVSPVKLKAAIDANVYEDGEDATTSGTAHNFTGIPAGMNEIDVFLDSVSATGSNEFIIQIGTGGVPTTTGYHSVSTDFINNATSTVGFVMRTSISTRTYTATMQLRRIPGTNKWQAQHFGTNDNVTATSPFGYGYGALSGTLDNIRLRTSGADSFDAGGWSIRCRK
jgi:hypothetical protein